MTIENKIKRVRELDQAATPGVLLVGEYRQLAYDLADECERLTVKAHRYSPIQQIRWNQRAVKAEGTIVELRAELKAFKAKQVDLLAKAYDEGRNYVDDRGSEE